jgi:hypothetical protein
MNYGSDRVFGVFSGQSGVGFVARRATVIAPSDSRQFWVLA